MSTVDCYWKNGKIAIIFSDDVAMLPVFFVFVFASIVSFVILVIAIYPCISCIVVLAILVLSYLVELAILAHFFSNPHKQYKWLLIVAVSLQAMAFCYLLVAIALVDPIWMFVLGFTIMALGLLLCKTYALLAIMDEINSQVISQAMLLEAVCEPDSSDKQMSDMPVVKNDVKQDTATIQPTSLKALSKVERHLSIPGLSNKYVVGQYISSHQQQNVLVSNQPIILNKWQKLAVSQFEIWHCSRTTAYSVPEKTSVQMPESLKKWFDENVYLGAYYFLTGRFFSFYWVVKNENKDVPFFRVDLETGVCNLFLIDFEFRKKRG